MPNDLSPSRVPHMTRDQLVARIAAAQAERGRRGGGVIGRRGDHALAGDEFRPRGPLVPAAVLVPLVARDDGYTVLLTQRAASLRDHAGQISFPGGRIEVTDHSPEHAAMREAREEIGLPPELVEIVGRLDTYEVRTGYEVTPVIGMVSPPFELAIDMTEVAEAFEVPLSFVLDAANHERHSREIAGKPREFWVLPWQDRYIWGATAGMLVNLYEVLAGPSRHA